MTAIIAIHGWKGNQSSMKHIAEAFNIEKSQWTFLEAPYTVSKNKYSWFDGMMRLDGNIKNHLIF